MIEPRHARTEIAIVGLALAMVGCSCDAGPGLTHDDAGGRDASTTDAAAHDGGSSDAHVPDAHVRDASLGACGEPFELEPDEGAEARATTALAALAPGASLLWAPDRGTFSSILGLAIEVPDCPDGTDVYEALYSVIEESPDLFQIDRDEWRADGVFPCSSVTEATEFLRIRRIAYGPYEMRTDVMAVGIERRAGVVTLFGFGGTYVPRPTEALIERLEACPDRPDAELEATLRARPFDYTHFVPPPSDGCVPAGMASYTAAIDDELTLSSDTLLVWDETSPVTFRRLRSAVLEIDRSNHTPQLIQSDANCEIEGRRIGWIRTFDAVTGAYWSDVATPVPGCTVC